MAKRTRTVAESQAYRAYINTDNNSPHRLLKPSDFGKCVGVTDQLLLDRSVLGGGEGGGGGGGGGGVVRSDSVLRHSC